MSSILSLVPTCVPLMCSVHDTLPVNVACPAVLFLLGDERAIAEFSVIGGGSHLAGPTPALSL
jgi:hypothetical protein